MHETNRKIEEEKTIIKNKYYSALSFQESFNAEGFTAHISTHSITFYIHSILYTL